MNIAFLASNLFTINRDTKSGIERFVLSFINQYSKSQKENALTVYASGDSELPIKIESVSHISSSGDPNIGLIHYLKFELALISKAFQKQDSFDIYHANLGNSEDILPFAPFVHKPILITLHSTLEESFVKQYYALFKDLKNIYYISISNNQRKAYPDLNYIKTIYHGIDIDECAFNETPVNDNILWIGRGVKEKGLDIALEVIKLVDKEATFFVNIKKKTEDWARSFIEQRSSKTVINYEHTRDEIIKQFQNSKLFLFPIQWEEPFGLVMLESMASGTPVVAFARGAVPEIIIDGVTGFIVNSSDNDIRGNYIIKKTGIEGLKEAIQRIYAMTSEEYKEMRRQCRKHIENNFTVSRMVKEYENVYQEVIEDYHKK